MLRLQTEAEEETVRILPFPAPRPEPDWWYSFLDELQPAERAFVEREVAPPSEQTPLSPNEREQAARAIERFEQRQRFTR